MDVKIDECTFEAAVVAREAPDRASAQQRESASAVVAVTVAAEAVVAVDETTMGCRHLASPNRQLDAHVDAVWEVGLAVVPTATDADEATAGAWDDHQASTDDAGTSNATDDPGRTDAVRACAVAASMADYHRGDSDEQTTGVRDGPDTPVVDGTWVVEAVAAALVGLSVRDAVVVAVAVVVLRHFRILRNMAIVVVVLSVASSSVVVAVAVGAALVNGGDRCAEIVAVAVVAVA